jgi:hypothetical protein
LVLVVQVHLVERPPESVVQIQAFQRATLIPQYYFLLQAEVVVLHVMAVHRV